MPRLLCVDIGSTWTKGILADPGAPAVLGAAQTPTTQEALPNGLRAVIRGLLGLAADAPITRGLLDGMGVRLSATSSAKGGLAIAAVGIVPELTVKVARLAAASAGGRVAASFAYALGGQDVERLEALAPDIILLCGGTDGGNESFVTRNARALAGRCRSSDIIYAGNRALRGEVGRLLGGGRLAVVDNVMPAMDLLDIEPARAAIRDRYLGRIVEGKGLEEVRGLCGEEPRPTPLALWELLAAGAEAWAETLVIDMGGATTDVYSVCPAFRGEEGTVLRGIPEPALSRTVEGDLGMRVSAPAAAETGARHIAGRLAAEGLPAGGFASWVARVHARPETLPGDPTEQTFDDILAEACLLHALRRHAGTAEEAWTPGGRVRVQRGKDLRSVRRLVASGGWLGRRGSAAPLRRALEAAAADPGLLLPRRPAILPDAAGILPLLGCMACAAPAAAASLALSMILDPEPEGGRAHA
jgi:uncharacterized protein (TIGR01319 family)